MRTAIYVFEMSSVTISATNPRDAKAPLYRYNQAGGLAAVGMHKLEPGIYMIVSSSELDVNGPNVKVEIMPDDKGDWPSPKATVIALEQGASSETIKQFFRVAQNIDVDR